MSVVNNNAVDGYRRLVHPVRETTHWTSRQIRRTCMMGSIHLCRVSDRVLAYLKLLKQKIGGQGKVVKTVVA